MKLNLHISQAVQHQLSFSSQFRLEENLRTEIYVD